MQCVHRSYLPPLVVRHNKSANKSSHNHDLVNNNGPENCRPRQPSREEQVKKQERRSDEPINVANIEDGAVLPADFGVGALVLDCYGGEAEVGAHGEVGDARDEDYQCGDVVEDAVAALLADGQGGEGNAGN